MRYLVQDISTPADAAQASALVFSIKVRPMIYDPNHRALYDDDGNFIKVIQCPLAGVPEHMRQFVTQATDQYCESCEKTVHCLDGKTDHEAKDMVAADPEVCFFASARAQNVTVLRASPDSMNLEGLPVIHTVHDVVAMQLLQAAGYHLLVKTPGHPRIRKWQLFRTPLPRLQSNFPLSAYIIPPDLKPGTQVFLAERIETKPESGTARIKWALPHSCKAIWDGESMIPQDILLLPIG